MKSKLFSISKIFVFSLIFLTFSCKAIKSKSSLVIWTSCPEFAQYIELFNRDNPEIQATLIYKENPSLSLPPTKDELSPDIIVSPWLCSVNIKANFKSLDYLFDRRTLSSDIFYPEFLQIGKIKDTQYLLPVSFNLPSIIFSSENRNLVPDEYTLTLEQIRTTASSFNTKSKSKTYKTMGFVLLNNPEFLYTATKINNVRFKEKNGKITWDNHSLTNTIESLSEWIIQENTSSTHETDFAYKYLFMPVYRQVTSGKTLFSYSTSSELFNFMHRQDLNIDYRWISNEDSVAIEDDFLMMGISKKTRNLANASKFISWFFKAKTQESFLQKKAQLNLNTELFGIAGGFSSLVEVTEKIIPIHYTQLLTNIPPIQKIKNFNIVPSRWQSYKSIVLLPYLEAKLENSNDKSNIEELEKEWRKKVFD